MEVLETRHTLLPIPEIARKLNLRDADYEPLAPWAAKLKLDLLHDPARPPRGKLILVTATTPTASGEGKTVTAIGLVQALERIGKNAVITSREPSLGPVFGMKGGAAGGGASQIEPSQRVNLHFTGDLHAITAAHNLLAALIDAHLFHGNDLQLDPENIWWPRAMDMNDRALRSIRIEVDGKRDGANRRTGFVITAASEIMAILALARDQHDLRHRLDSIVIGASRSGQPVRAADLNATGAMMALLNDALLPNLVQTTEGTPAIVHCGPFGNIAHGTSSVISQQMGLRLADYVVNEAGFAADLGAEKYIDIVMGVTGVSPSAAVLVTTVQSLRNQGEGDLERGFANLARHAHNLQGYGLPVLVAISRFRRRTRRSQCARRGLHPGRCRLRSPGSRSRPSHRKQWQRRRTPRLRTSRFVRRKDQKSRDADLRGRWHRPLRSRIRQAAPDRRLGLRGPAHLHRQDAVFLHRRSKENGSPDRLDPPHQRCSPLRRSRLHRPHRGQHDAHARSAEGLPRRGNRRDRRRRHPRRLVRCLRRSYFGFGLTVRPGHALPERDVLVSHEAEAHRHHQHQRRR